MRISDWSSDVCSSDLIGVEPWIQTNRLDRVADNDSDGLAQAFARDGVLFGSIPLKITQRPKGKPFNGYMLLDGHRYAVQRPHCLAGPEVCIGIFRLLHCPLVITGPDADSHSVV